MTRRRVGWLSILGGAGLALCVQVLAPVGVPLYDGVVVQEPYRYLNPAPGQPGDPGSANVTVAIVGGISPTIVAATTESPPQAQLIAQQQVAFEVPAGATSVKADVTPIEPPAPPPEGRIIGNVYRFAVTDDSDNPLTPKPCEGCRSLVLRSPENAGDARIMRFAAGTWSEVETLHGLGLYSTNPTALGDYALIEGAGAGDAGDPADFTLLVVGGAIAVIFFALIGFMLLRSGSPPPPVAGGVRPGEPGPGGRPPRIPAKRRGSRRPPSGRSGE
jgi:hypothetical protein